MSRFTPNQAIAERFVIQGWLASGGMAEVYVAEMRLARGMTRRVALKRIHSNFARDPEFVSMFLAEARLSSELVHPGIAPVLDVVEADGDLIIVLDYVAGWDLASILERGRARARMPLAAAVHVGRSVCEILAYVHGLRDARGLPRHLVHRDVNPSNVLIAEDGSLRLLDFGVAKAVERSAAVQTRGIRGKLAYLAPEQAEQAPLDARTDLFGVGLTVFEAVTGQRALAAASEIGLLEAARAAEFPSVDALRPETPPELVALIAALLARDPGDRPPSAEAAAAAFAELERTLAAPRPLLTRHVIEVMGASARAIEGAAVGLEAALAQAAGIELARPATRAAIAPAIAPAVAPANAPEVAPTVRLAPAATAPLPPAAPVRGRAWVGLASAAALVAAASVWAVSRDGPAPTAPPVARTGYVRVDTTPPNARVTVDGVELDGRTPLVFESPDGAQRRVRVALHDHLARTTTCTAIAGQTQPLAVQLQRIPGRLFVDSTPPAARVRVDDVDRGATPLVIAPLPRGELSVTIDAEGYASAQQQISLVEAPSATVAVTLERIVDRGWLDVSVTPWAKVKLDGVWVAESTPVIGRSLSAGTHVLELHNPRLGKIERRVVRIKKNRRTSVIVRWP